MAEYDDDRERGEIRDQSFEHVADTAGVRREVVDPVAVGSATDDAVRGVDEGDEFAAVGTLAVLVIHKVTGGSPMFHGRVRAPGDV